MAPAKLWSHQCWRQSCTLSCSPGSTFLPLCNSLKPVCEHLPVLTQHIPLRWVPWERLGPHLFPVPLTAREAKNNRYDWAFKIRLSWVMLILWSRAFPNNTIHGKLPSSVPWHHYSHWPKFEWHAHEQTSQRSQACGGCSSAVCTGLHFITSSMCEELKILLMKIFWRNDLLKT